jgi:hypothetical protein
MSTRRTCRTLLPPGAARNAVDCALWDLEAKQAGRRCGSSPGCRTWARDHRLYPVARHARQRCARGGAARASAAAEDQARHGPTTCPAGGGAGGRARGPDDRRRQRGLDGRGLCRSRPASGPAGGGAGGTAAARRRGRRAGRAPPLPVCADESCHDRAIAAGLAGKYDMVNIKLDKTGGLTEALALRRQRRRRATASWSAAWSARRSPWRPRCWWRRGPRWSISTRPCCWPKTVTQARHLVCWRQGFGSALEDDANLEDRQPVLIRVILQVDALDRNGFAEPALNEAAHSFLKTLAVLCHGVSLPSCRCVYRSRKRP